MKLLIFLSILFGATSFTNSALAQSQHFTGNWTKLNTTFNFSFDLHLQHLSGNKVEGYFEWKLVSYDKKLLFSASHYKGKIGKTAKEFVRGTYNSKTKEYHLQGYKKEDPDQIIGMDEYQLKVDKNGDIGGDTKANNSWKGRINGKAIKEEVTS